MKMVKLNVEIEISLEKYEMLMATLKDVSGNEKKEDLEAFIASGLEYDIEEDNCKFLFD